MVRRGLAFLALVFLASSVALADGFIYLSPDKVALEKLLPPPPDAASAAQQRDLAAVLEVQERRTPDQIKRAIADDELSIFRFQDVLGPAFTAERLPVTVQFFKRVHIDARLVINASKDAWHRPRPFLVSPEVKPLGEKPRTQWSYPSGTTIFGSVTAIILANMVPEKRAQLFARADEYGANRVVLGVHYPTDVEASRIAGTVIAAALMQDPAFTAEFTSARAELRAALGL